MELTCRCSIFIEQLIPLMKRDIELAKLLAIIFQMLQKFNGPQYHLLRIETNLTLVADSRESFP